MKSAIYCRVSTDNQEREGTSLQTQKENCLTYCQSKHYEVSYRFSEAYSGLSLERPELDNLRELVRDEMIDVIVCYSLDRLSRDPGHGVIITQELEKHGIKLETVTEDVDNSELGKLISYIRGYASKVEAEKIRERTMRGRKARAKEGRFCSGGAKLYGYDYIKVSQENGGRRVINEVEATWVQQAYQWLVDERLSTNAITYRLRALNAPTKSGKTWSRRQILANTRAMVRNTIFAGAFAGVSGQSIFINPCRTHGSDWRRGSESNRRMRLLQSPALPLGYPATPKIKANFDSHPGQVQSAKPSLRRCAQSSFGLKIPTGVMMPVINSAGVTSNPGFRAPLVGLATRI